MSAKKKMTLYCSLLLVCSLTGPAGSFLVLLNVRGVGLAKGHTNFTYDFDVTGLNPVSGSTGGESSRGQKHR